MDSASLTDALTDLLTQAEAAIANAADLVALNQVRAHFLGKKGQLTQLLKGLSAVANEEKPKLGEIINQAKQQLHEWFNTRTQALKAQALAEQLQAEQVDVSLPGRGQSRGAWHPISQVRQRIEQFFARMGFSIAQGPEIETDHYNFAALNIPPFHPARAMQDTFYLEDGRVLRTQTSPVQIRSMEKLKPPLRLIAPGRVFRCDSDLTHTPMFHQVEGLMVDEHVTFAELQGVLRAFLHDFFGQQLEIRLRPSYFPFTEPSAEVDMTCVLCQGRGETDAGDCRVCKKTGWLEVLGCGMVHPNVLQGVGIDHEHYNGWAFGMGIDRLAMLYFGIDDLRAMFETDLRFLQQF